VISVFIFDNFVYNPEHVCNKIYQYSDYHPLIRLA